MKWSEYKEEILSLKNEKGYGSRKIEKHLKDKYGIETNSSSIRKLIAKWNKNNQFEEKLSDNNFTPVENWSHGWLKTKEASIFIKNKEGVISFEEMRDDFKQALKDYSPSFKPIKRTPITDSHLLVIDIADLHIGKLASANETGEDYDVDEALLRAADGVRGILDKASGFPIDQILFIIGNDVLHVDNANKSTTSGTGQDVSGMWYDNYKMARELYVAIIERLLAIADVHILHCPSNHDYVTGFMLADSIHSWFRNHPNITFDVSPAHRKYYQYGDNLLGASHGDGAKMEHMPLLMANESKEMWAKTSFRYIYLHHVHHMKKYITMTGKDYHGVTVEFLRSASATDSWHHRNGFQHAPKAIEGFIHHKKYGQVCKLTHLFK